jgi:starvation-inducible DNA-binding protein
MTVIAPGSTVASATSAALQATLAELIDLSLQAKHYHWTVIGREFRPVHLQLDEITDQVRLFYDDVAERLATLGVPPDGRLATVAATSPLPAAGDGWQTDRTAVEAMCDRLNQVADAVLARAAEIGDADLVSQGILIETGGGLQKQAWMLRVQAE